MKTNKALALNVLVIAFCGHSLATAQNAPGEDPITLTKFSKTESRPSAASPQSTGLDPLFGMQGWLKARVTRYEARAYSDAPGNILTENDAVTTASAQGLKKVCVQEVGSSPSNATGFNQFGPKGNNTQIVVLKGDLVNICK